ncbi:unnamed protein product [Lymnaea stagnalis]|uniref:THD domain-containing protein n=1 Tax=Lymnaea stagnalis TaxID=6523 RepID=A0AAV2HRD1_LYMST
MGEPAQKKEVAESTILKIKANILRKLPLILSMIAIVCVLSSIYVSLTVSRNSATTKLSKDSIMNKDIFSKLQSVDIVQNDRKQPPLSGPSTRCTPVSAHKFLNSPTKKSDPDYTNSHLLAPMNMECFDYREHARGVMVTDEGLVVQHHGLYFVYSNIYLSPGTNQNPKDVSFQTRYHYVNRVSPNHPMNTGVLMRCAFTQCPNCIEGGRTSYAGGFFYLKANDIIRVTVSGEGLVTFDNKSSFLGLYMLAHNEN